MNVIFNKIETWRDRFAVVGISNSTLLVLLLLTFVGTITELIGLGLFLPIFQFLRMDGNVDLLVTESSLWGYLVNTFQYFGVEISLGILLVSSFFMFVSKQLIGFVKTLHTKRINLRVIKYIRDEMFSRFLYADIDYQEQTSNFSKKM